MRSYIKRSFLILLTLVLLGVSLAPAVSAAAEQPIPIDTVSQLVINDMTSLDVVTQQVVVPQLEVDTLDHYYETIEDAAAELRTRIINREDPIVIGLKWHCDDTTLAGQVLEEAFRHTGVPNEGDYLRWHYGNSWMGRSGYVKGGVYYLALKYYSINYYTTAQQEAEVDTAVAALLDQLDVKTKNDYEKICAVYDYICNNVTYDYAGLSGTDYTTYSAWKALTKGTSVCQGYANLFYRLMLELGIDCRLIAGVGITGSDSGAHAWNIVQLNGHYYNLDATWDASLAAANWDYEYFLRSPANFTDHIRDAEYETAQFHAQYPMDTQDFSLVSLSGDMNGDDQLNDADALYLLRFTLFPSKYPISGNGDVDGNGAVNDADALYLLRHTLFPSKYPLYPAA